MSKKLKKKLTKKKTKKEDSKIVTLSFVINFYTVKKKIEKVTSLFPNLVTANFTKSNK